MVRPHMGAIWKLARNEWSEVLICKQQRSNILRKKTLPNMYLAAKAETKKGPNIGD